MDPISDFGQEIQKLIQYYVAIQLKNKSDEILEKDQITLHKYKQLLDKGGEKQVKSKEELEKMTDAEAEEAKNNLAVNFRSVCLDEIKMKVMDEPAKHKDRSVFLATREQQAAEEERRRKFYNSLQKGIRGKKEVDDSGELIIKSIIVPEYR